MSLDEDSAACCSLARRTCDRLRRLHSRYAAAASMATPATAPTVAPAIVPADVPPGGGRMVADGDGDAGAVELQKGEPTGGPTAMRFELGLTDGSLGQMVNDCSSLSPSR